MILVVHRRVTKKIVRQQMEKLLIVGSPCHPNCIEGYDTCSSYLLVLVLHLQANNLRTSSTSESSNAHILGDAIGAIVE